MSKKNFIPYPFYWDDAPIDLSFLYKDEKPAGKHGFLTVKGDRFAFEDGSAARFWGTNFNSGSCFPNMTQSEKIAKRLAKFGINLVRFHQLDAEWSTPNIFQFTKGERKGNTLELDPESMRRLDYFIYCLKAEGIYIYMDLLTYRKFKSGDGVVNAVKLGDAAKPYSIFDPKLIELQKKFCRDIWNHVNEYSGVAYKDEPAIILTEIINECDMFCKSIELEPYRSQLESGYRQWAADKGMTLSVEPVDFTRLDNSMKEFYCLIQENYFQEMYDYMRWLGVKIPITGTNWAINAANRKTHRNMDFNDGHTYWYEWKWKEDERCFDNKPMVKARQTLLPPLVFARTLDKPYFVSEWDDPWPNEWRAESSLYLAAVGLLQGYCGFAIHTYKYSSREDIVITGKEASSGAIGNTPYREGVFNTFNDPAKFGMFYHAALMYIRGDVSEAQKSISIKVDNYDAHPFTVPALGEEIAERHKTGMIFDEKDKAGDIELKEKDSFHAENKGEVYSDTNELYRNWEKGIGWINTERTKALYGFYSGVGEIKLGCVGIQVESDFAVIALSSLSSKGIGESDNILMTVMGRSENTNMKFNESHEMLLDIGEAPILAEVVEAKIRIKTEVEGLRVLSVNAEGFYAGEIPSAYNDGWFEFETGKQCKSVYYLIQAE